MLLIKLETNTIDDEKIIIGDPINLALNGPILGIFDFRVDRWVRFLLRDDSSCSHTYTINDNIGISWD